MDSQARLRWWHDYHATFFPQRGPAIEAPKSQESRHYELDKLDWLVLAGSGLALIGPTTSFIPFRRNSIRTAMLSLSKDTATKKISISFYVILCCAWPCQL